MFGNEGNPFDALGNSGIGSSSGDLMDKYKNESSSTSSYGGSTLFSGGENKQKSVFDTISSTGQSGSPFDALSMNKESEGSIMVQKGTFLQEGNIAHDLNVRGQRYGQMSVTDKMRGIQANRLNIDSDSVALEESYADKSFTNENKQSIYMEEEEEEEEEEKKKISESKGSQGIYGKEKEEEEDELKKLKIERLIAGGQGVYGNIEIEEKENDLIVKIKEIIEKMSSDKIAEIIQRYDLKPEKDHKDKLKLKIAREILQERSLKEI